MTTLILVCPGQTDWGVEERWQGQADRSLNEQGRRQAQEMARELGALKLTALFSSDLARAVETARIIATESHLTVVADARLSELDLGQWQGMTAAEIEHRYPEDFHAWRIAPQAMRPPAGEGITSLAARVVAAINDIVARYPTRRVGVVSHEGPIAAMLCCSLGLGLENLLACIPVAGEWDELVLEGELPCALAGGSAGPSPA